METEEKLSVFPISDVAIVAVHNTETREKCRSIKYTNLVLEGGGVLGLAYIGALQNLHSRGLLAGLKNFAGSSAGAIAATALACGASFNFLYKELSELNIIKMLDYGYKIKIPYNVYSTYGMCPGEEMMRWFERLLERLTGNKDITFKQVHDIYGGRLVITGTRLIKTKRAEAISADVCFDYETHPNMPLKVALRITTSIPVVFRPYFYDGFYWVDGGILNNYPIRAFHNNSPNNDQLDPQTLGLMLVTNADVGVDLPPINDFYSYIYSLLLCFYNQSQKTSIDEQDWKQTIQINCGKHSSMNFNIPEDQKNMLVQAGFDAVNDYFSAN